MPAGWRYAAEAGEIKYFHLNVAASQTDTSVVAAVTGKKIRVLSLSTKCGATATTSTYESDGSSDTEKHKVAAGANGGEVLPFNEGGWFETNAGEGLVVTTGTGSETNITGSYIVVD